MNPVLILTHNNLELTQRCVASLSLQDIPTCVHAIDNDSTDGTWAWLKTNTYAPVQYSPQIGVSAGWNVGLEFFFENEAADHVLVLNNDTVLPPFFYRSLLAYGVSFVTGNTEYETERIPESCPAGELFPHPDFSAFLMRREVWEKVGPFDERMKFYAQDLDYHVRAHCQGIQLWNSGIPFYHPRSSTLRNASPEERAEIEAQANQDRAVFRSLYGCGPNDPEYDALFC